MTSTAGATISILARPTSSIPQADTPDYARFLADHIAAAFQLIRDSHAWKQGKQYHTPVGGAVQTRSAPSGMEGRAAKLGWHLRHSVHKPATTKLDFDDFRAGLLLDHEPNEKQYIPDIVDTLLVSSVRTGQAEVWRIGYSMPLGLSDRDFLQLQLLVDLPRHPAPFSEEHQRDAVASFLSTTTGEGVEGKGEEGRRSFIVIQLPVEQPSEPEGRSGTVRAAYGSVEAVWESEEGVEWLMMVQSDARGRIPVVFQEMAMNGKIAEDVPHFVAWAQKVKQAAQT